MSSRNHHERSTKSDRALGREVANLSREVSRLTSLLRKQNHWTRRLITGAMLGIGTAVGASIIAGGVIVGIARLLSIVGLDRYIIQPQAQQQVISQPAADEIPRR